jgi:hypothetical protein
VVDAAGIPSAEAFGQPFIGIPAEILDAGGILSQEAFGQPLVELAEILVQRFGGRPKRRIGQPIEMTMRSAHALAMRGIPSAEAVGRPTLTLGDVHRPRKARDEEWFLRRAA